MTRRRRSLALSLLVLLPIVSASAQLGPAHLEEMRKETRLALVIGNADYTVGRLNNPINDARGVARTLRALGFDVLVHENLDYRGMRRALADFGQRLNADTIGLFYYSGHGLQLDGRNYLLPIGADVKSERHIRAETLDLDSVLAEMEAAKNRLNIVILDACRDNPFARRLRSLARGLAPVDAPKGTFIAYATSPGRTADDGEPGKHGIYTGALLIAMREPGLKIEDVFKRVRQHVDRQTGGQQIPWEASSLTGDFVFALSGAPPGPIPPGEPVTPQTQQFRVRVESPLGSIGISTRVDGVEVFLGDQRVGQAQFGRTLVIDDVAVGTHRLRAEKSGYKPWQQEVQVTAQARAEVLIELKPLRPPVIQVTPETSPTTRDPRVAAPPPPAKPPVASMPPPGASADGPKIVINYPPNDVRIDQEKILVLGLVTDIVGVSSVQVSVNGVRVVGEDVPRLSRAIPVRAPVTLQPGENVIEVTAIDNAGNVSQTVRTVTRTAPVVAAAPPPPPPQHGERRAVVIGVGTFEHSAVQPLKYAERDARAVYDFLTTKGGFKKENVEILTDSTKDKPTLNNIRRALGERLARRAGRDDTVLIYFAGHGAPEVDTTGIEADGFSKYLVPRDADPESLYTTGFPMEDIRWVFARLQSERVVLIIDASYTGIPGGGRTFARQAVRAGNLSDQFLDRLTRSKGRFVLTASGPNEAALELPEVGHGIFTYYLLEGMAGKADRNRDGVVTVGELYEYVENQVTAHTRRVGGTQRPIMKGEAEGTLPLIEIGRR